VIDRRQVAIGVFEDTDRARDAIGELKDAGFSGDDISVLMPDRGQTREFTEETGTKAGEGAATGLLAGGLLGGLAGWLVGIGALAIPGVGPFIAAGAFATALGGAAVGAGVGAIAGALVGMGIPEEEAKYYEDEVRRGGRTLVTVRAGSRMDEADDILHRSGAYDVQHPERRGMTGSTMGDRTPLERRGLDQQTVPGSERRWEDYAPTYRSRWQQRVGTMSGGRDWSEFEPHYRYGWEARSDPRYRDRSWTDVEPELRRDWEGRYRDRPWDDARENVRDAWEDLTESETRHRPMV
jgi:hypothetical protein